MGHIEKLKGALRALRDAAELILGPRLPKIPHTLRRKCVKNVYTMLLLRKVLSSIRMHLMYSAKTGSSHRSLMQFFDMAD